MMFEVGGQFLSRELHESDTVTVHGARKSHELRLRYVGLTQHGLLGAMHEYVVLEVKELKAVLPPPERPQPTLKELRRSWLRQPEDSRRAVLSELRHMLKGWEESANSEKTQIDVHTLRCLVALGEHEDA